MELIEKNNEEIKNIEKNFISKITLKDENLFTSEKNLKIIGKIILMK